jgi:Transglycosylase SLT domain/D-alanyl-D-alanine carboxypeptidase
MRWLRLDERRQAAVEFAATLPFAGVAGLHRREEGQALLLVLTTALLIAVAGAFLFAYGQALGSRGRYQRVADLAAISAARVMRTSYPRLFEPPVLPDGLPNPAYMSKLQYLALARAAAGSAAVRNGVRLGIGAVTFPDLLSFAPTRVRVELRRTTHLKLPSFGGRRSGAVPVATSATAAIMASAGAGALVSAIGGGGYSGPLALRQGKPMRPDTAAAFDQLAAAARNDGIPLSITSAFRSDSEQAKLFAAHPDPKWVAPPGHSLHRNGTELDLGPPSAYGWLAANAPRFGFVKRYAWEAWHFGFVGALANGSAEGGSTHGGGSARAGGGAAGEGDGDGASVAPAFVPDRWRAPLTRASAKWNVPIELLAAQLYAESNFNPFAVSPAGARGLAQFTPGTANAYGLRDPFDGEASIDAQAHLMRDLLTKYKTAALALAAYNAGAGAVDRYHGIPPFAETQGYVTRVLGLMNGAGAIAGGFLGIRLIA